MRTFRKNSSIDQIVLKVYRGAYRDIDSILDLQGDGGSHHEMLGAGLYTTTDYELAQFYAPDASDPMGSTSIYNLELKCDPSKFLEIDSTAQLSLKDPDFGDCAQDLMVDYRIPPFALKLDSTLYIFGIDSLNDLDDQIEYSPPSIKLSKRFKSDYKSKLTRQMKTFANSQEVVSFLEKEIQETPTASLDGDTIGAKVCKYFSLDENNISFIDFVYDLCIDLVSEYEKSITDLGLKTLASCFDVSVDSIHLADLNELSSIALTHGFSVVSVSEILQFNETLIVDINACSLKIVSSNA